MQLPSIKFKMLSLDGASDILSWVVLDTEGACPLDKFAYSLYPELINKIDITLPENDIKKIIKPLIKEGYQKYLTDNKLVNKKYQKMWNKYNDDFMSSISNRLNIKWPENCMKIRADIGLIPVFPRNLKYRYFSLQNVKEDLFIDTCMHECCHFLFFEKWKKLFSKWEWEDFDSPSLIWLLSEIVIDPILNCSQIKKIFDYNFKSYDYLYKITTNNINMMNYIKDIFSKNNIEDSIRASYQFLIDNKEEITSQI